ncbi:MAG: PAS domain-containing sensor histidine kinase [Pseudomonadota bacterium]
MTGIDAIAEPAAVRGNGRGFLSMGFRFGPWMWTFILLGLVLAAGSYVLLETGAEGGLGVERSVLRTVIFIVNLSYVLALAALIGIRLAAVLVARRQRSAGSQLHMRLTGMFALIAFLPTVIVAIFATLMLNFGIERWFSERVGRIINNSLITAEAYEREHLSSLLQNVELMRNELNQAASRLSPDEMREYIREQSIRRNLDETFLFSSDLQILARGEFSYLFTFEAPTQAQLDLALEGETVLIDDNLNGEIRALVHLRNFADAFLYVTRDVQGEVLRLLDDAGETKQYYDQLRSDRDSLLINYAVLYLIIALVIILSAILLGLWFAERLARPVGRLAGAAEQIGLGNLDIRVKEERGDDEIALLSRAFNRMTSQVKGQRDALIRARDETELRRNFIEAVLSGVTAGVVGLDAEGRVELANEAAANMLGTDVGAMLDQNFDTLLPAFKPLIDEAARSPIAGARGEVRMTKRGQPCEFLARVAAKSSDDSSQGFVLTFDDITALASAQRMAAWGDVARRIAHEIKNPLTPIQLSADRMRRKYVVQLGEEGENFEQYIDVITRQAGDIRRMVDEFSKFARMPEPEMQEENLIDLIEEALVLQREGRPEIAYENRISQQRLAVNCDRGLINQCLTNLLQNAADAIESRHEKGDTRPGRIAIDVLESQRNIRIQITDNGIGLPKADRDRLTDPYVTKRAKGTGLGLAIVAKIVEQHGGELTLADADPNAEGNAGLDGAEITMRLLRPAAKDTAET